MGTREIGYTHTNSFTCLEDLEHVAGNRTSSPLALLYCGTEECVPGWTFGPHIRENYVVHVITGGRGTFSTRGTEYRLSKGDAFMIYPGEETVYQADRDDPWTYMWIGFNGLKANKIPEAIGFSRESPVLTLGDTDGMSEAIRRMLDAKSVSFADSMKRTAAMYDALAIMVEMNHSEKPHRRSHEAVYVDMAIDLMTASYDKKVRISDIAAQVGVNRSYLTSIFKQVMHISPQEFLISFRLEKAAHMLRTSDESVGSIATSVGYADPLTFSKAFRKKYNISPSEYRRNDPELNIVEERGGYTGFYKL